MPKVRKRDLVERREKIPRQAKNNVIRIEEIKMIKQVLQKERELRKRSRKKGNV